MRNLICLLALVFLVGCKATSGEVDSKVDTDTRRVADGGGDGEVVVPLADVPKEILDAARDAVPGLEVTRVEREVENGVIVYDVAGTAGGQRYEVEVDASGKVLAIEDDDDDDDDDDGEDDDR